MEALKGSGWNAVPLELSSETESEVRRLVASQAVDVVFVAMHGGFGEGGPLQDILEKMRVSFTGPAALPSRLAMDKILSRRCFQRAGLHVAGARVVTRFNRWFLRPGHLKYPVVVKPTSQGSSIGVSFVAGPRALRQAVDEAFRFDRTVLIEDFIRGREVTVSVLNGRALPIVEVVPKKSFFDFQAKYEKGMTEYLVPAPLDPGVASRLQEDAVKAYHALGCRHLSRVDMIVAEDNTPYVLEVNTIPGMTQTSLFPKAARAAGMSFDQLCGYLVELALNPSHGKD
jgi:D-alanine-D-alanine ligase